MFSKMSLVLLVMYIQVYTVCSAPLLMNLFPHPSALEHSQQLQQQLMELQASPWRPMKQDRHNPMLKPVIILLPDDRSSNIETNGILHKRIDERIENEFDDKKREPDDADAVVVDADSTANIETNGQPNAFLLLPNARLSIGDIISAIPFLPIEINVPDTFSWVYNGIANGISGIISIIGQSRPFSRPTQLDSLKLELDEMQTRLKRPIMLVPVRGPIYFRDIKM